MILFANENNNASNETDKVPDIEFKIIEDIFPNGNRSLQIENNDNFENRVNHYLEIPLGLRFVEANDDNDKAKLKWGLFAHLQMPKFDDFEPPITIKRKMTSDHDTDDANEALRNEVLMRTEQFL
ncbi:2339_t:CDS:2 [Entrophospora sp. SA101]|nr:2339_t:CDS:2 [Entrophospora sp. SA101]